MQGEPDGVGPDGPLQEEIVVKEQSRSARKKANKRAKLKRQREEMKNEEGEVVAPPSKRPRAAEPEAPPHDRGEPKYRGPRAGRS